ncbi:6-carboxytetrahydropterin synthase [Paracoccus sp. CPCC 101403]|uniref:6-carboxy-5,6,7,8-tetrahydropterin synthase n=1 Tax=Paracoccus broussonetiae TaxID=3075834 RepID=A0ABU3EH86_9RHOB|nr:6-carboxytetrahydropterin synthase [Paracoccus sp. CPCC 101403]MDT1063616.1 6-carboxytetrahydropterin synthase [Paracoccus sp. CPCC 101403]
MFAVEVRDHIMIAHSLPHPAFGPAQAMHGATYTVDVAFCAETLDETGVVVDIGLASQALAAALASLRYKNLDEVPEFQGKFTTTEFLCQIVFDRIAASVRAGELGDQGRIARLRVTLQESHLASAWYEGAI